MGCRCSDSSVECCDNLKYKCSENGFKMKRNLCVSAISGLLFFSGWWMIFDIIAQKPTKEFKGIYHLCGVASSLAVVMINMISRHHLQRDAYSGGCCGPCGAMLWLFLGFTIGFGAVIGAGWILFVDFVIPKQQNKYYGIAIFFQNLLIFMSGMVLKFGRSEDMWGDGMEEY